MTHRFVAAGLIVLSIAISTSSASARDRLLLDFGWRFQLGDPNDAGKQLDYPEIKSLDKAQPDDSRDEARLALSRKDPVLVNLGAGISTVANNFDDNNWRKLDLPHDWVVELPFDPLADKDHGFKAIGPNIGSTIGWYRRSLDLSEGDKGKSIWVEFDGVYRNSLVWFNGHCLGRNVSGYTGFAYDLSKYANFGGKNELVVRVDASREEGWFYEGAGIYRHVWLMKTMPVHIPQNGTWVVSEVSGEDAAVTVRTQVRNDSAEAGAYTLVSSILDSDGKPVTEQIHEPATIGAGADQELTQRLAVSNAHLWSPDSPALYTLVTTLKEGDKIIDTYRTTFGIRTIRFDVNQGFFVNGKRVELQGTCNHQDHAGVGSALPDRLQYFRVEKLKEMGSNAYRTSHNDPTPELLEACDRLGMMVMDEHRQAGDTPEHLSQLRRLIVRDRNHPCVVIWSIANEENEIQASEVGARIATKMQHLVHQLDPTRQVTAAMNKGWGKGFSNVVDIQGCNYFRMGNMDAYHSGHPTQPIIGTEDASTLCTRGIYQNDPKRGYMAAYDLNIPNWGSRAEQWWPFYVARPFLSGAFAWTGFDYRGEPTPYKWPCISSHFGIMDTCGFPKDEFYYYQSVWSNKPVLHLFPHWNWAGKEGKEIPVWCYSNYSTVELFLNGASQGRQNIAPNSHAEWKVKYEPGVLEVKAFKDEQVVASQKVETTGEPAKLQLTADRSTIQADGEDLAVVSVAVLDAQGRVVPTAGNRVEFEVSEGGKIIGVGNGDPSCHEPDKATGRSAFNGLCMAIVQGGRKAADIRITAKSVGLESGSGVVVAKAAEGRGDVR